MAQQQASAISKAFAAVLVAVMVIFFSAVSAQDLAPAPAPMDAGAAYSLPFSGAFVGAFLVLSLLALLKH